MYDSTNVSAIPTTARLVLTYIDGSFQTDAAVALRIPTARRIPTTTTFSGSLAAVVYDCERGDGNAVSAADWARRKLRLNERPTIYCSRIGEPDYGWAWVKTALTALGIGLQQVDFGIADYTGTPHLILGSAFTQYANPPSSGGDYDLSITNGVWPNPPPHNMLNKPAVQIIGTHTDLGYWIVAADGGVFAYGDAPYHGSLPSLGITPSSPIVSMQVTPDQGGYRLLGADGGVFDFGNAMYHGSPNH